ncbi:MAG: glycerate kinase [Chloroflexota bacterium]
MKTVVVAPQAFKGSLPAHEVARAIARGIHDCDPGILVHAIPVADGGEGTVDALLAALGGERRSTRVEGPLGQAVDAAWGITRAGDAVVEMAAASGLPLLAPGELDPQRASTYGTGQLIRAALDFGARRIIIGIGGSATNDGGAGALQALGLRLLDAQGRDLQRGGAALAHIDRADTSGLDARLAGIELRVMCDVTNPLLGPAGATAVYGPQKGVQPHAVAELNAALARFAQVVERDLGVRVAALPGSGAAGGLGAGLLALGGNLEPGAELVLDLAGIDALLAGADLAITGEGRLDGQSAQGKASVAVARRARRAGVPTLLLAGGLGDAWEACHEHGVSAVMVTAPGPISLADASAQAAGLIVAATRRALRLIQLGHNM